MNCYDDDKRDQDQPLSKCLETTSGKAALWINDDSGQIIDSLPIESRIRRGSGGCQLCHEELDRNAVHARLEFDDRHLPKLILGNGNPVCEQCVEWVRLLHYHAENSSVSTPRFDDGDLVLRVGSDELYEVLEAKLTGIASVGVWFPTYTCQRIEIQEGTGRILPACRGLIFDIPDCELQPLPPRYPIARQREGEERLKSVDLVGRHVDRQHLPLPIPSKAATAAVTALSVRPAQLLLGKRGGSP
jgi:hypothetical protein